MSLSVENLSFSYGKTAVLRDVTFTAEKGELLSVLGPNGVGKTTLFRCVLGTLTPASGRVTVDGCDLTALPSRERARRIAYIPQIHPATFGYTALDTVLMGAARQLNAFQQLRRARRRHWSRWVWETSCTSIPARCPAVRCSVWPLPALW